MNRRESKVLRVGGSLSVVLPADWVRGHGLRVGDLLNIGYDGEMLTVRPVVRLRARGAEGVRP